MRPGVAPALFGVSLLTAGCGPGLIELSPATGSALGGDEVRVLGQGLTEDAQVYFGDAPAETLEREGRDSLRVRTPPGLAGWVPVRVVDGRERAAELESGFEYQALELEFTQAAPHYLPDNEQTLTQAIAIDLDGDGLHEVALVDEAGALVLWRNTGLGAFEALPFALPVGPVGGLVALPASDQGQALFLCHQDHEGSRVLRLVDGELVQQVAAPLERGPCQGAQSLGPGRIAELRTDGGLRVWDLQEDGLLRGPGAAEEDTECGDLSSSEGAEASCEVLDGAALLRVDDGQATLGLQLPTVSRADLGLQLLLEGATPTFTVSDAAGERFSWTPLSMPAAGSPLLTPAVATWEGSAESPTLPLRRLELTIDGGNLSLDRVALTLDGGGRALVSDFTLWAPEHQLQSPGVRLVTPSSPDTAVVGTALGVHLLSLQDSQWRAAPEGQLPELGCPVDGLVPADADGDGVNELAVACVGGQDRLLRSDGAGHWFDDTVASMPVDAAAGSDIAAADFNLDGMQELVVANPGGVDRLYGADGEGYQDWSSRLSLSLAGSVAALPLDVDSDGDLDLLLVGGEQPSRLFIMVGE